ncbi:sodium:solute symporter family protein [Georgenia sp. Z1344]|uniref:sodium:solute symporter family protein n=1 Tax=Georgenia sp. Z1344 TaxID=3416706 RepID=UPI003CEBC485
MSFQTAVLGVTGIYLAVTVVISFAVRRSSKDAEGFTTGGKTFPAILIGLLMASEFIGTSASMGTAQGAYEYGISAAWNLVALGIGFVLFSFFLAHKYKSLGQNTISGVLKHGYGERVRLATSIIMIVALGTVAVAVFAGGSAVFTSLLDVDRTTATVVTAGLAVLYVAVGGMRSVVYTNVVHALVMLTGIVLAAVLPLRRVGGLAELRAQLPDQFFDVTGVGLGQIVAWMIAGAGATFATQYIIQAIASVGDEKKAKWSSVYSSLMLIPYGICAAIAGMCARVLFPEIDSLQALPELVVNMHALTAGIVISGLVAALLGTISAITLAISTLLLKDFYRPFLNRDEDPRKDVVFIRVATVVVGIVPMILALYASDVLAVTFLGKALRSALAVLVLLMFYAPRFGSRNGALVSIVGALIATVGWFLAGNPFGVDNAYVAIAVPLVVMTVAEIGSRMRRGGDSVADGPRSEASFGGGGGSVEAERESSAPRATS